MKTYDRDVKLKFDVKFFSKISDPGPSFLKSHVYFDTTQKCENIINLIPTLLKKFLLERDKKEKKEKFFQPDY
jgi:hypothetical protein